MPQIEEMQAGDGDTVHGADLAPADDQLGGKGQADDRKDAGGDEALVEGAHDRAVGAELDEERADDRGDDAGGADRQRIEHRRIEDRLAGEEDRGEHHRGDHRHRIGLEQVRGHAGAIADIVADIVGDGRRIAGIVLGNAGFDLADEVGADVGALGEDAAAETGEDRDQRGAEAEGDQRVDDDAVADRVAGELREDEEVDRDAEEREAGDQQAGDRARAEGDVETGGEALARGLCGADVGADRDHHAGEAGDAGENRADGEADRDRDRKQPGEDDEDDDADNSDGHVLTTKIGGGAFLDRGGDLLHAGRAGVGRQHRARRPGAVGNREQAAEDDQIEHRFVPSSAGRTDPDWPRPFPAFSTWKSARRPAPRPLLESARVCTVTKQASRVPGRSAARKPLRD